MTCNNIKKGDRNDIKFSDNTVVGWQEKLGQFIPNPGSSLFILTLLLIAISVFSGKTLEGVVQSWGKGFIGMYPFCMEIILFFLTGYALAITPVFKRTIRPLADVPQNSATAALYLAIFSIVFSGIHWGLGMVGGILLARETAKKLQANGKSVCYPLLIVSGCAGLVIWETGFSGIVPLYLAEKTHFLSKSFGVFSINQTILAPANIITSLVLLIVVPVVCYLMHPKQGSLLSDEQLQAEGLGEISVEQPPAMTTAERLERSRTLVVLTGIAGLLAVGMVFIGGGTLELKNYLFIVLMAGICFRKQPMDYPRDFEKGAKFLWFVAPVLVMFAALQGVIGNLGEAITNWLTGVSSATTYSVAVFGVSALSNILVPITGAQWMLEGGFILEGAKNVGASLPAAIMAFGYGASWAKLIQIFFVLSWFSIVEVRVREVTKYFSFLALGTFFIFIGSLLFLW